MMHTQYMTANAASELHDAFVKQKGIMVGKLVLTLICVDMDTR